jgi:hypothetical protein
MKDFEQIFKAYVTSCSDSMLQNPIRKKEIQRAFYSGALSVFSLMDEMAGGIEDEAEVTTVINKIQAMRNEILSTLENLAEEREPLNKFSS